MLTINPNRTRKESGRNEVKSLKRLTGHILLTMGVGQGSGEQWGKGGTTVNKQIRRREKIF